MSAISMCFLKYWMMDGVAWSNSLTGNGWFGAWEKANGGSSRRLSNHGGQGEILGLNLSQSSIILMTGAKLSQRLTMRCQSDVKVQDP